jgi:hypothetical protein
VWNPETRRVVDTTIYISPTIIAKRDADEDKEAVMYVGSENALVVFRSEEEVEKFRDYSGRYLASEGYAAVGVGEAELARVCVRHAFQKVCMPEPWTGTNRVDFFDAADFCRMLRESLEG